LTSRDGVQGLQGRAGSGKISVLESIHQGAEQNGYIVEGFAPTSRAAKQFRDAGIKADTLQHFLAGGKPSALLTERVENFCRRMEEHRIGLYGLDCTHTGDRVDLLGKVARKRTAAAPHIIPLGPTRAQGQCAPFFNWPYSTFVGLITPGA